MLFGLTLTLLSSVIGVAAGAVQGYFGGLTSTSCSSASSRSGRACRCSTCSSSSPASSSRRSGGSSASCYSSAGCRSSAWSAPSSSARATSTTCARRARSASGTGVIMFRHVLPNAMVATLTFLPFILSGSITTLTSLDFLGFGLPPGSPSLGEILAPGQGEPPGAVARHHRLRRAGRDAEPPRLHRRGRPRRVRPAEDARDGGGAPRDPRPVGVVRHARRRGAGRRGTSRSTSRKGETVGPRGRERLREVRDRAVHPPAPAVPAGPASRRQHRVPGPGAPRGRRGDAPARAREPDRDDLPGADDLAEPAPHDREAGQRGAVRPQGL